MRTRSIFRAGSGAAGIALATALALAGCNRANQLSAADTGGATALPDLPATLPLSTGPATSAAVAPPVQSLPEAAPIRTVRVADRSRNYAYADAAWGFSDALGDAPPDYDFAYDGVDPWAWQGYDGSQVFVEPIDAGYRYYYYRAGADAPYFVRDPDYAYGYDNGQLAVVYGRDGSILPWVDYGPRVVYASRYLVRGRDLWRAARLRRDAVAAEDWNMRRAAFFESRQAWGEARARQPGWIGYAQRFDGGDHWREEEVRRAADARRYAVWEQDRFRTPPPPRAIPANWAAAPWARDQRRYAPVRIDRVAAVAASRPAFGPPTADRGPAPRAFVADPGRQMPGVGWRNASFGPSDGGDRRGPARPDDRPQQDQARLMQMQQRQAQVAQREQARAAQIQQRQAQIADRDRRDQVMNAARDRQQQAQLAERAQRDQARAAQSQRQQAQAAARAHRDQARVGQEQQRRAQMADRDRREQGRDDMMQQRQAQAAVRAQRDQLRGQQAQQRQVQMAERAQRDQARGAEMQQRQAQVAERAQRDQARAQQAQQRQMQAAARPDRGPRPEAGRPPREGRGPDR